MITHAFIVGLLR